MFVDYVGHLITRLLEIRNHLYSGLTNLAFQTIENAFESIVTLQ